ncbi:MAG: S-layer protein [Candidatus Aenigmarchaeota archaeon]|nr:S-layer protein [Candidatus Aenigmarchaeota archaeon]
MHVVQEQDGRLYALPTREARFFSGLAMRIIQHLAKKDSYPKEMAQALKVHEQKVYYHVRKLEKKGIVQVVRREEHGGALAKVYALAAPSFSMVCRELAPAAKVPKSAHAYLEPFIDDGTFNGTIVVGSPDPHGPEKARSRDASYAIDFGVFLGTFLASARASVRLDTEVSKEDLSGNLILIGGPVINRITNLVNPKMPVRFDDRKNIHSLVSGKKYTSDDAGLVVKMKNPYNENAWVLVIAGKRYSGTRSAILAFLDKFDELSTGNRHRNKIHAKVVDGIDTNYDGVVDDVRILE